MRALAAWSYLFFGLVTWVRSQSAPVQIAFDAGKYFGPDGPWQTVSTWVGSDTDPVQVHLYPGGSYTPVILSKPDCSAAPSNDCLGLQSGIYDPSLSPASDNTSIQFEAFLDSWNGGQGMNLTGSGQNTLDTIMFKSPSTDYRMPRAVFSSVSALQVRTPAGGYYPAQVGSFALGAPHLTQEFTLGSGSNITGNLVTGFLRKSNTIPSSSFGLHIGSVPMGQPGSLVLGGYDKSRVLGDIGAFDISGDLGEPIISMIDVTIGVEQGETPFKTPRIGSLYRANGNESVPVSLNPTVPYMFLPLGTCEAIAEYLPVRFDRGLGLYIWNTQDPQHGRVIGSPSYLQFTFQQSSSTNLTIKLPFALLNLTLESPIVDSPQQYFPCKPYNSADSRWYLGRAFLQAAHLAINWEQRKFFLGQAPGPNSGPSQITAMQPDDISLSSSPPGDFASSWARAWTIIPLPSTPSSAAETNPASQGPSNETDLAPAAKAGVGVGVTTAVMAAIGIFIVILWKRRTAARSRSAQNLPQSTMSDKGGQPPCPTLKPSPPQMHEMGMEQGARGAYSPALNRTDHDPPDHASKPAKQEMHEMDVQPVVHEACDRSLDSPRVHELER